MRSNLGAWPTTPGPGPRRPSGTAPAATRVEAGSAFVAAQTDVNLAELLINQGALDEAEAILTGALRVLRASGAALSSSPRATSSWHESTSAGVTSTRHRSGPPRSSPMFSASATSQCAGGGPRAGRGGGSLERPAGCAAIIDAAERKAGADAAFSLPRICLQRAWALLALGRARRGRGAWCRPASWRPARQELPYEEALLLRVGSRADRHRGDDGGRVRAWERAGVLLAPPRGRG